MGSSAHLIVVHDDPVAAESLADGARARVEELEARWSRFRESSEVSRLNRRRGVPVRVSSDTYLLVSRAAHARDMTAGRYSPFVGDAMIALGYDRDFVDVSARGARGGGIVAAGEVAGATVAVADAPVGLDPYLPAVTLPVRAGFDPGGIGKGLAADIVVSEALGAGARGAMVNIGGDVVATGSPPDERGWVVGIEEPSHPGTHLGRVTVVSAAVCTSSPLRRVWTAADGSRVHHLLDPNTGRSVNTRMAALTVVAGEGWWAEAMTKALFVAASGARDADDRAEVVELMAALVTDEHVLAVFRDGDVREFGPPGAFDRASDARVGEAPAPARRPDGAERQPRGTN